jgi:hypothetical protein
VRTSAHFFGQPIVGQFGSTLPIQNASRRNSTKRRRLVLRRLEQTMCWRCAEIDKEIDHYRCLCTRVADEGSIKSLHIPIEELKVEKARVHIEGLQ